MSLLISGQFGGYAQPAWKQLRYSLVGIHPDVEKFLPVNRWVQGITPWNDLLLISYGDWNNHVGSVSVAAYDTASGEWVNPYPRTATEAIKWVNLNGTAFGIWVDPEGYWTAEHKLTSSHGGWHEVELPELFIHAFDMVRTDDGRLWLSLSHVIIDGQQGEAAIWQSSDNGETWSRFWSITNDETVPVEYRGFERIYRLYVDGNRVAWFVEGVYNLNNVDFTKDENDVVSAGFPLSPPQTTENVTINGRGLSVVEHGEYKWAISPLGELYRIKK